MIFGTGPLPNPKHNAIQWPRITRKDTNEMGMIVGEYVAARNLRWGPLGMSPQPLKVKMGRYQRKRSFALQFSNGFKSD